MELKKIVQQITDESLPKKDLATAFVWYHYIVKKSEITLFEINNYFTESNLPKYNLTYLKNALRISKNVTKGVLPNSYKPVHKYINEMAERFPFVMGKTEEIITDDTILPEILINSTRGYIETLGKQINASYNNNIFDGCAILMRRLLEILLVAAYEVYGKKNEIEDGDGFKTLNYIINHLSSNKPFQLSKESLEMLDSIRQLSNFSAHKIYYNAKRKDIDNIKLKYRLAIEELLYTTKIKQ